jgi:hypothetical protein
LAVGVAAEHALEAHPLSNNDIQRRDPAVIAVALLLEEGLQFLPLLLIDHTFSFILPWARPSTPPPIRHPGAYSS